MNASGQVVGVTTAGASLSGDSGNIGVGFAIPIDRVKQVVSQIVAAS